MRRTRGLRKNLRQHRPPTLLHMIPDIGVVHQQNKAAMTDRIDATEAKKRLIHRALEGLENEVKTLAVGQVITGQLGRQRTDPVTVPAKLTVTRHPRQTRVRRRPGSMRFRRFEAAC